MAQLETFRPRGGYTVTLGVGGTDQVDIPNYAREVQVNASVAYGRVLVNDSNTPVVPTATNYGYLAPNAPMTIRIRQGRDTHIHLSSTVADNQIVITFGV